MRPSRLIAVAITLALYPICPFAQQSAEPPRANTAHATKVDIDLTGKLFGYYRIRHDSGAILPPVGSFTSDLKEFPAPLLLGMGDNFAPEFGARLQEVGKTGPCSMPLPKLIKRPDSFFKSDQRLVDHAYCDAVANFLEQEGYRALVPGREDFLYGSVWLRNIGTKLRQENVSSNLDRKTIMLGANLRIVQDKPPKSSIASLSPCGLLFDPDFVSKSNQRCSSKGDDLVSGSSIIPEKFRLLRELDGLIAKSASNDSAQVDYFDPTQVNSDIFTAPAKGHLTVKDQSKLLAIMTRRQLLIRDMLESFSVSMSACPTSTTSKPNSEGTKSEDPLESLIRDYRYQEIVAVSPEWETARKTLASMDAQSFGKNCGHSRVVFAGQLAQLLGTEQKFEQNIEDNFSKITTPSRTEENKLFVVEPGILGLDYVRGMMREARRAILLAIGKEQQDVGFTEVAVADQTSGNLRILVVGVVGVETMQSVQEANLTLSLCVKGGNPSTYVSHAPSQQCGSDQAAKFKVNIADPVQTTEAVVRAATEVHGGKYDLTILMAQMPHTEAEELVARVRSDFVRLRRNEQEDRIPVIDVAISEAQKDHSTSGIRVEYGPDPSDLVPVLTPAPAYDTGKEKLAHPIIQATVTLSENQRSVFVRSVAGNSPEDEDYYRSAMSLLASELPHKDLYRLGTISGPQVSTTCVNQPLTESTREQCDMVIMHAVLRLLAMRSKADAAMLERRDLFLGKLPPLYDGYEMCDSSRDGSLDPTPPYDATDLDCRFRVALARVLWQASQATKIMVSGKDIAGVLQKAQLYSDNRSALITTDISQQYLQTEGIVDPITGSPAVSSTAFSVVNSADCHDPEEETKPSAGGTRAYCVNGVPIQGDHAYWVITSSHLATEKTEYGLSGANPADYIAKATIPPESLVDLAVAASQQPVTEQDLSTAELKQQQAKIFHVDIGKIVAGYNFQRPLGGSANIINRFQGVSDATASSAGSANLDLEQKERTTWEFKRFGVGLQDDAEFDRQVQDNLTGKFVNGNFTKNLLTAGPFLQLELPIRVTPVHRHAGEGWLSRQHYSKSLPRWLLVLAPAQFQTQITGSHLNFSADSGQSQVAYVAHRVQGLGERTGLRHEFDGGAGYFPDKGSYFEAGGQFVQARQVLSALTFSIPGLAPITCFANGAQSFANCAPSPKILTKDSSVVGQYASPNEYGWYWDIHIQKGLFGKTFDKATNRVTLTLDSKGDFFKDRGSHHSFSTQTWYDAPASVAIVFPVFRNLGFAPTYTAYFYGNQVAENYLLVNTFSVNLRWYFDRDSHVPFWWPAFRFKGPASADETQPTKSK